MKPHKVTRSTSSGAIDYNEFVAWTQGGKKTLGKNKKANALVPDLQAEIASDL